MSVVRVVHVILTWHHPLPVFPDQQTWSIGISQTCQEETHALQQMASLFDQLVDKAVEDVTAHRGPKPSRPYITEVRELDGDFFKVSQN